MRRERQTLEVLLVCPADAGIKSGMEIRILLSGERLGPFSETQVRQYMGEGLVSPSDLAMHEGMEDWQSIDWVLANLRPSAPGPETDRPDAPSAEPPPPAEQAPETEPPLAMNDDASEMVESASAPPSAEPDPPPAASRKRKRRPGKIVIQPILPLEATVPAREKSQTQKTALVLESLGQTTSLPPVTEFLPEEEKAGETLLDPVQASPEHFSETHVATETPTPPTVLETPAEPTPTDDSQAPPTEFAPPEIETETETETPAAEAQVRQVPRGIIYACAGMIVLILCLIFSSLYLFSPHDETPLAAKLVEPRVTPPPPKHVEAQNAETGPKTAAEFSARGFEKQTKGDLDGAIADYNRALEIDPKNVATLYRRGLALQTKGNLNGAMADYNTVLGLDLRNANAFGNRGFLKQARGDLDGALADYAQALTLNPKISAAYYNEGLIEVQKGDLNGAIGAYNHALDIDPKMAVAYYDRGVVKDAQGNLDGAIADYTQALTLNPKLARAYCDRGLARQSKGDPDGALADYAQAVALNPKMALAFYNRGLIKVRKGDLDGAIIDSTQAISLDPKNGETYFNRGLARFGEGNLDGAAADLKKLCELAPRNSDADSARLYIWLISTEQSPTGNADEELSASLQNDWNSTPEELSSKIAAFLLGHLNESDLIASAASPDPSRERGQYCKIWYFAGMKRLLAGDMTTGVSYLQKCVETGQKDHFELTFAQAKLRVLGQGRETPSKPGSGP